VPDEHVVRTNAFRAINSNPVRNNSFVKNYPAYQDLRETPWIINIEILGHVRADVQKQLLKMKNWFSWRKLRLNWKS